MSQKFKLSDDQNTLIVVGGQFEGQYKATEQDGCESCSFWVDQKCELKTFSTCSWGFRKDSKSIIWIKKENTEMTEAPAPAPAPALQHRHFDLIVAWAKNPTQLVWFWSGGEWVRIRVESPSWTGNHYAIGEKPTMPPVKMVKYDGGSIEFPKPAAKIELEMQSQYWAATIYGIDPNYWTGHSSDWDLLDAGLIQLTSEGAEKQSEALVELLKNHAQKWG